MGKTFSTTCKPITSYESLLAASVPVMMVLLGHGAIALTVMKTGLCWLRDVWAVLAVCSQGEEDAVSLFPVQEVGAGMCQC